MDSETLLRKFKKRYKGNPRIFKAPGRVNLIGEHTDYNDGFVFPMAIDRYTYIAVNTRNDKRLNVRSENLNEAVKTHVNSIKKMNSWADYVLGVAWALQSAGVELSGADILIHSEVPVGSGLSSSAALEVSTALALLSVNEHQMDLKKMALLCQKAENEFVGMKCGIMDQFIACFGQQDSALFLDCRSLEYQLIPLSHEEVSVVVCNTMVKHELGASEYNKRRAECEQGIQIMSQQLPGIKALRDVSLQQFNDLREMLPQIVRKRCLHVISENARTRQSAKALNDGDYARFGRLMHASHESLRDDYEVSCKELDIMVEKAGAIAGVLGARMTGGGFGGCTVNLVKKGKEHDFSDEIAQQYEAATHLKPEVYICNPSQGAHEVA